jgi:ketosteroid isomerase-like protein
MSRENVEVVRRVNEHLLTTGEPAWELIHEDVEVHDHDAPDQGTYGGHTGVARWLEDWGAAWAEWTYDIERLIDAGDIVVMFIRAKTTGRGSGVKLDREDAAVYTLRAGKIACIDYYNNRDEALQAVGLREEDLRPPE